MERGATTRRTRRTRIATIRIPPTKRIRRRMRRGRRFPPRMANRRKRKWVPRTVSSTGATTTCRGGDTRPMTATSARSEQEVCPMLAVTPLLHKLHPPPSSTHRGLPSSPTWSASWLTNDSSRRHGFGNYLLPSSWPGHSIQANSC
jgi:hypothetical protein